MLDNDVLQEVLAANDENTLNMGMRQPSPLNPALRKHMTKRIALFNSYGLVSSRECIAEFMKHYDLVA